MVRAENKYEARLLDEENTWGKPTDKQEKIVAMTAEIDSLKREHRGMTDKTNKSTMKEKKPAAKKTKEQKKSKETQKKKASDKWAWKNKAPKDNDSKKDNAFVKTFEGKKYFWCTNHNNGAGMWTLHHAKDCEAGKASTGTTTKVHIATFDTVDSDSDLECRSRQSQALTWLWLAITNNLLSFILPHHLGLALAAFSIGAVVILIIIIEAYAPEGPKTYVRKKQRPPKSLWLKAYYTASHRLIAGLEKTILNIKVR